MAQKVETSDWTVGNFVLFWMPHHYSCHLSCISHEINNFQKCFVQERGILLHFIDLFILCELHVMMFKKITYEGDIFILIVIFFLWIYGEHEMWIHIIIDASNGEWGGGLTRKEVLPRADVEFPAVFISQNLSCW